MGDEAKATTKEKNPQADAFNWEQRVKKEMEAPHQWCVENKHSIPFRPSIGCSYLMTFVSMMLSHPNPNSLSLIPPTFLLPFEHLTGMTPGRDSSNPRFLPITPNVSSSSNENWNQPKHPLNDHKNMALVPLSKKFNNGTIGEGRCFAVNLTIEWSISCTVCKLSFRCHFYFFLPFVGSGVVLFPHVSPPLPLALQYNIVI